MISIFNPLRDYHNLIFSITNALINPILLIVRVYIAWLFFKSGLTKIDNWESTLFLFEYEYMVPFFSPYWAALLATIAELLLPVLLVIGLFTRISAIGLTLVNVMAVVAYEDMSAAAFNLHLVWGLAILILIFWGAGKISVDKLIGLK